MPAVVVQKSLAEGFGLTVAEAMWKERPIVASAVGGIVDQIDDGEHGLLVADPLTCRHSGLPSRRSSAMPAKQRGSPTMPRARAIGEFLGDRHLRQYGHLFDQLATRP